MAPPDLTFQDWLDYGIEKGYCDEPHCYVHTGTPLTEFECTVWHMGMDFCVNAVRLREQEDE